MLIPLPGIGTLRLTPEQYTAALTPIAAEARPAEPQPELIDGPTLAQLSGLPLSFVMEMGRRGKLPSVKVGKYRRFPAAEALATLHRGDLLAHNQVVVAKSLSGKGKNGPATAVLPRECARDASAQRPRHER